MKFDNIKTHINKMHEIILAVPDALIVGPLLDWKKEYKKLAKDIRRGRVEALTSEDRMLELAGDNETIQKSVQKIQGYITYAVEAKKKYDDAVAPLVKAMQYYVAAKTALTLAAEITEKINELLSATPANPTSLAAKTIAWFNKITKQDGAREVNKAAKYLRQWNLIEWWWMGVPKGAYGLQTFHPNKTPRMEPTEFLPGFLHRTFFYPILNMLKKLKLAQIARLNRARKWGSDRYSTAEDAYLDRYGLSLEEAGLEPDQDVMSDDELIAMLEGDDSDTDEG
jgi:hypothetical protein